MIVGGAGQGTGRALAIQAVRAGYAVAGLSRTREHLLSLAEDLGDEGQYFTGYELDLQDSDSCELAVRSAVEKYGPARALVNCAATWTGGRQVRDVKAEDFRRSFDLNFYSALNLILPTLAHWQARDKNGDLAIVSLGATASMRGGKGSALYATAKGSLRSLSQSLAKELAPEGVHVSHLVIDGLIDNPRTRSLNAQAASDRFISMTSIADTILYLIEQPRDCWIFECDIRPFNENW